MASKMATCIWTACGRAQFRTLQYSGSPCGRLVYHRTLSCQALSVLSISRSLGRITSQSLPHQRQCSSSTEKDVLEKVNQEMVSQPQSKLFAVVHICGRQFKVTPNDLVVVSRLQADIGESIFLEKPQAIGSPDYMRFFNTDSDVLLAGSENFTLLGTPILNPSIVRVTATVVEHGRAAKIVIFKKKRRKNYKRKKGYRQDNTTLRINGIELKPALS